LIGEKRRGKVRVDSEDKKGGLGEKHQTAFRETNCKVLDPQRCRRKGVQKKGPPLQNPRARPLGTFYWRHCMTDHDRCEKSRKKNEPDGGDGGLV